MVMMIRKMTILHNKLAVLNAQCNYNDDNNVKDFLLPDQSSSCILSHRQSLWRAKLFSHRAEEKKNHKLTW